MADIRCGGITDSRRTVKCGGITDSPGTVNSVETISLARFAIEEHNKENSTLEFVRVVNEKRQVVAGILYYLTIEATDAGKKKLFEAKVWVKAWENFKEVVEFKEVKSTEVQEEFKHVTDS